MVGTKKKHVQKQAPRQMALASRVNICFCPTCPKHMECTAGNPARDVHGNNFNAHVIRCFTCNNLAKTNISAYRASLCLREPFWGVVQKEIKRKHTCWGSKKDTPVHLPRPGSDRSPDSSGLFQIRIPNPNQSGTPQGDHYHLA